MRVKFDEQLEKLNVMLIDMGALCEEAITYAVKALETGSDEMREKTFSTDEVIDEREREIETACLKLILQQQPVAKDLRKVSAALKMITDMERIGDQASDIAEIVETGKLVASQQQTKLAQMAETTINMVTGSVDAYVKQDLELVKEVIAMDDKVDELFLEVRDEIAGLLKSDAVAQLDCMDMLMIAKYYERIGDHATNIAEWVEFSITGMHKDVDVL